MSDATTLKRNVTLCGAYSLGTKYGMHNMEFLWSVTGPKGAITILMNTAWVLPQDQARTFASLSKSPFGAETHLMQPYLCSVDYHAREPQYEGQTSYGPCALLDGVDCYFDGSSLWFGEAWMEGFLGGGSEWLYARMEEEYRHRFEDGPPPDLTPRPLTLEQVEESKKGNVPS